jgi:N-acetylmuramoyl-L-alanine amidase
MKVAFALLLLWLSQMIAPAQNPLDRLERIELFGHTYVRLGDWARTYHFEIAWPPQSKEVYLTNRLNRLVLTIDSRKAELNHVTVWLSVPIAQRNGVLYLSPLDLKSMIHPVFYPPKTAPGAKIKTICLDPGHGGKDPGNDGGRTQEKYSTLLLAKDVRSLLSKAGFKVLLTRSTDRFVEKLDRPEMANRSRADLFVSLHYNSAEGGGNGAKGVETYCLTPPGARSTNNRGEAGDTHFTAGNIQDTRNALLAHRLQKTLINKLPLEDRGVKRARFAVLRTATMPAVLIECGFMSDPAEAKQIFDPAFRIRTAQAIVEGLLAYKRVVEQ